MKATKPTFDHQGYFGIRLPYRPISQLRQAIDSFLAGPAADQTDGGVLLRALLAQPRFAESLFLASPGLQQLWQESQDMSVALSPALQATLWRYVFRAYARATPYGLYAGMGTGRVGESQTVTLGANPWRTSSRPDTTVLNTIIQHLSSDPAVRSQLQYALNNSLYEAAGEFRFSEGNGEVDNPRIQLSSLPVTPDLRSLVESIDGRSYVSFEELTLLFGPEHQEAATAYIHALIDANFLVSSLTLPVTGPGNAEHLLAQLGGIALDIAVYEPLREVIQTLSSAPVSLHTITDCQEQLRTILLSLDPAGSALDNGQTLIQTDLFFRPEQASLSADTVVGLGRQFADLLPVLAISPPSPLARFARRFTDRFGQQTVDLLTVLDPQVGIGLSGDDLSAYPLLNELPFQSAPATDRAVDGLETLREKLYSRFVLEKRSRIDLTEADIQRVATERSYKPLPPSWYLHGELVKSQPAPLAPSDAALNDIESDGSSSDWQFVLNSNIGVSPAFLLGRFCLGDPALRASVETMCAWEQTQYPEDILAEIVHLPVSPARAGNIVARPVLRRPEIPYLTAGGAAPADQLRLADLAVRVTDQGSVLLVHKPTGRRVRPRHTSAHNPELGDEIYQFLSLVHRQEFDMWGWSWGALSSLPALPRIVYRNLIVTPAQWTIKKENMTLHTQMTADALRSLFALPRYVLLIESDNKLLLDLDFGPTRQILMDEIKKQPKVLLKEWIAGASQPWVTDGNQSYVSELILPFKTLITPGKTTLPDAAITFTGVGRPTSVKRVFMPGEEWLYLKIYLHERVADEVLTAVVQPTVDQARQAGWLGKWFFIRYADPDQHLRLRFETGTEHYAILLHVLQLALQPYVESGLVIRVQADSYERELERYGPQLTSDCETIFMADSDFFLSWLSQADQDNSSERYALATGSMDTLLSDFGLTMAEKTRFSQRLQQRFFEEQGRSKEVKQKLNRLFREREAEFFNWTPRSVQLASLRSEGSRSSVDTIRTHFSDGFTDGGFTSLLGSLVHMSLNRIFSGQARRHEMVVYHFMARRYEKQMALSR